MTKYGLLVCMLRHDSDRKDFRPVFVLVQYASVISGMFYQFALSQSLVHLKITSKNTGPSIIIVVFCNLLLCKA